MSRELSHYLMRSDALEQSGGPDRSRYLALAADAAWRDGQSTVAESLRLRLLRVEPGHPAGRFPDWATAARSSDMLIFLRELRVQFPVPPDRAESTTAQQQTVLPWSQGNSASAPTSITVTNDHPAPWRAPVERSFDSVLSGILGWGLPVAIMAAGLYWISTAVF